MLIYNYDEKTKEYLGFETAEADPEETKIKGEFVPLVPRYATLTAPMVAGENEIPVFKNGKWELTPDFRGYYLSDEALNLIEIEELGAQTGIIVNKELAELIQTNPGNFKIQNGEIVQKTAAEIEEEKAQEEAERIAMLNLTAADVERAIYKAKGLDFDDVITLIQAQPLTETGEPLIDIKALKIELKANNFYRGNPYINQVGTLLGFLSKQLDDFFETNDYTKLLSE